MITNYIKEAPKPLRYIVITGSTAKTCRQMKLLLKRSSYYCQLEYYKNIDEIEYKEAFYLPDFVIVEVKRVFSLFSLNRKIEQLREIIPGVKVILYNNMLLKNAVYIHKGKQYPIVNATDDEDIMLQKLESALSNTW